MQMPPELTPLQGWWFPGQQPLHLCRWAHLTGQADLYLILQRSSPNFRRPGSSYSLTCFPRCMQLTFCSSNLTDWNKLYCWSNPRAARVTCTASNSSSCLFSYYEGATPIISGVTPDISQGGATLVITGKYLLKMAAVGLDKLPVYFSSFPFCLFAILGVAHLQMCPVLALPLHL